jgi:hypothetical protein
VSSDDMTRAAAIAAGLHVGICEWCGDDVWSDRGEHVESGGYVWHSECADRNRSVLEDALS